MKTLHAFLLSLCLSWALPWAAAACSVSQEYVRPSNYELVQLADAIVVASPVAGVRGAPSGEVTFRVQERLKGAAPDTLDVDGVLLGRATPGDADNLAQPNPEAMMGACTRRTFAKGAAYVLFLHSHEGRWLLLGFPFAKVSEDYEGPQSLWVRTIREYATIQRGTEEAQFGALAQRLEALAAEPPSAVRDLLAQDVIDHLSSMSPYKPTAYLVATYEALEKGQPPRFGVRPPSADKEDSPAQALTEALLGRRTPDRLGREQQMDTVLRALVTGSHPDAAPLFERLATRQDVSATTLGRSIRFFAQHGQLRRAFDLSAGEAMRRLPALEAEEGLQLAGDITAAMWGDGYDEGKERWRSDPYVAERWPSLALSLYWLQANAWGEDQIRPLARGIEAIPVSDYRAHPLLALALAELHDGDVEAWAIRELADEKARLAADAAAAADEFGEFEDPDILPLAVLVRAYSDERDAALLQAFCIGGRRRAEMIRQLGLWGDSLDTDWLSGTAVTPGVTPEERTLAGKALMTMHGRHAAIRARTGGSTWLDVDASGAVPALLGGTTPKGAEPIACPARRATFN